MTFTQDDLKRAVWTFLQAGFAALVVFLGAQSELPDSVSGAKQLAIGAGLAFVAGAVAALKNWLLPATSPLK